MLLYIIIALVALIVWIKLTKKSRQLVVNLALMLAVIYVISHFVNISFTISL